MSDSQDNLLDYEYDIQGVDLLDQSADLGGEPMEEEVVMLEKVQVLPEPTDPAEAEDPGYMLACGERDIFDEDVSSLYTASQLIRDLSTPTQDDPGVSALSPEVEEILRDIPKPEGFDWVAKMDAYTEERDNGQVDPFLVC